IGLMAALADVAVDVPPLVESLLLLGSERRDGSCAGFARPGDPGQPGASAAGERVLAVGELDELHRLPPDPQLRAWARLRRRPVGEAFKGGGDAGCRTSPAAAWNT